MQKENETLKTFENNEVSAPRATSEATPTDTSDGSVNEPISEVQNEKSENTLDKTTTDASDFEELIKGPYKDAFAKKVQSIINKRFKEQKNAENKSAQSKALENNADANEKITQADDGGNAADDPTYTSLIKAGVDPETAYRVLHLNEFMDSSMRYGAELAAKHLADSIRQKAARPSESALSQKGYVAKTSVATLTPQKRKELAEKALMGEQIGF